VHQLDFKNFLLMALGSCNETAVLIQMARDLGYISLEESTDLLNQYEILGKQINKFVEAIKSKI
jgi:four helix bundle protein